MSHPLFILGGLLFLYMNGWFLASLIKKRNDLADVAWGLGFVLLSWSSLVLSHSYTLRNVIITLLVSVWGVRLAWHIHKRNQNKPEDARYQKWRKEWGKWVYLRSYFQIYLLQGTLLFIIALPVLWIHRQPDMPLSFLDGLGLVIWIIGFCFESVSDAQLRQFLKDPHNRGKLMTQGLWQYSRHPNYFGEVTQWWGLWLIALSVPQGWKTIVGPLTITILILYVSGIPLLEEKMVKHPEFTSYQKRVSRFFPWWPKE